MLQQQESPKGPLKNASGMVRKGLGPIGTCICQYCGYCEGHQRGVPCNQRRCPKCGITLKRLDDDLINKE